MEDKNQPNRITFNQFILYLSLKFISTSQIGQKIDNELIASTQHKPFISK